MDGALALKGKPGVGAEVFLTFSPWARCPALGDTQIWPARAACAEHPRLGHRSVDVSALEASGTGCQWWGWFLRRPLTLACDSPLLAVSPCGFPPVHVRCWCLFLFG